MAVVIHLEPQLQKCLNKLYKAGGRAALAAERVETIITTLASRDDMRPAQVNKLTRHGEARIDKCKNLIWSGAIGWSTSGRSSIISFFLQALMTIVIAGSITTEISNLQSSVKIYH